MGSGSTSRPSARTPASASSHITLESQSKNWIFIWLTLSTLQVGHFQPPSPPPFYFTRWHLFCVRFLFFPRDAGSRPHECACPAQGCSVSDVPCSLLPFPSTLSMLPLLLPCHVPCGGAGGGCRPSPSLEDSSYPKGAAGLRTGARLPRIIHQGESWR